MPTPLIAFLTDYGMRDGFVAVCHGVIARTAPEARVLDVSHDVPAQDVRHGAIVLARVAQRLPPAIYVGVVDPGVGTARRGIGVRAGENVLVGPDNGLLIPAAEASGGISGAYELTNRDWWLPSVGETFHGRDVFAPVAAHLASGEALATAGNEVPVEDLVRLPDPTSRFDVEAGRLVAGVRYIDGFGNVQLASHAADVLPALGGDIDVRRDASEAVLARATAGVTFQDAPVGDEVLYTDSDGQLAIAVNQGSAADRLGVRTGDVLVLSRSPGARQSVGSSTKPMSS